MKMSRLFVSLASLSLVSIVPIQDAAGQCRVNEAAKLTASDAAQGVWFGSSVSVSGDVVVVGSLWADGAGMNSGSAYVYRFVGDAWVEEQKLTASDGSAQDTFGFSVSVNGDVAVIGAVGAASHSGAVYVYRFNGTKWVEEQKLNASDGADGDTFGWSVSVSGDVVVVGADRNDDAGVDSGSAYVYRYDGSTWVEEQKLTASNGAQDDQFGWSVSVSGNAALIGAHLNDDNGKLSGSAYVYRFDETTSTWVEEQKLTASDAAKDELFGHSVSLSGDVAVVSSPYDDDMGSNSGSAYVFRFSGGSWVEEQKLTASDGTAGDQFGGSSVSISGDVAVIGALFDDDACPEDTNCNSGSAYIFRFDGKTWIEERKLAASDSTTNDRFGGSVSTNGNVAVVGARLDDDACPEDLHCDSGSAYMFGINPVASNPPCGAIDARQPSAPDGSDPAGWDSIAMTFDEPPGEMIAEDFAIVTSPPGDAPTVTDVTVDGSTATIHFDEIIATQAWTTITHWPTGAVTRIGYLPADVNNDKLSNANDVISLIDVFNSGGHPLPPAYATDIDRSGIFNPNDVLRVIDLLNGAGVYDEYLNAALPQ